ncbi:MAG: beta-eliminating lyase-related protein [Anaerolineaceae bacterium]|nr:beta-eliminating lyase-related protein [Anaerolineaceae bacterium]
MDPKMYRQLMLQCSRFLSGRHPQTWLPKDILSGLAEMVQVDTSPDIYGTGEYINGFEEEIANILGKEAAVFMPSGTMAQQIALRIWTDRKGIKNVAFHPSCHLERHELKAYQVLHGLHGILIGSMDHLITLGDLKRVSEPLGALLLELPQREIGGQLPVWEELLAIIEWAGEQNIPLHMDGARLWECKPFYQKEYSEIARLFDSVYVSLYKGLGAVSGAVLAGPADFIAESRIWLRRHGGNLKSMYPFVLSAKSGLDHYLGKMDLYHQKAVEVSRILSSFTEINVLPDPPHTNMMHMYIQADYESLEKANIEVAQEKGILLLGRLVRSSLPGFQKCEVTIQDAALELSAEEIRNAFEELFEKI